MMQRLMSDHYDFSKRQIYSRSARGWSADVWSHLAQLGVLGLAFPEEDGGLGAGPIEISIVMYELGRALALEPFVETAVKCGTILRRSRKSGFRDQLIASIIGGSATISLADAEPLHRSDREVWITDGGGGLLLNGTKIAVEHGGTANWLLVTARHASDVNGACVILAVSPAAPGVRMRHYRTSDGTGHVEIVFEQVELGSDAIIVGPEDAAAILEDAMQETAIAACSECTGIMDSTLWQTVDYLKTRRQFGAPLSSFQALQHRMVDMFIGVEQARAICMYGSWAASNADASTRRRAVAAAELLVHKTARQIGQEAVQLHGGVGVTEELAISHCFRRLTRLQARSGYNSAPALLAELDGLYADDELGSDAFRLAPSAPSTSGGVPGPSRR
jgi:alkylation response protein AidB-like acyl-CoA dehydrogenase